jgi:hypothetical protein
VERSDGHSWCPDRWSLVVRTGSGYVWTRAAPNGRTIRIDVRTCATCPLIFEAVRVRTALIHRPVGDPTEAIYTPSRRLSTLPHQNLPFWHLVCEFLQAFGIILLLFVFLSINLTFQVFFLSFSRKFFLKNC